MSLQRLPPNRSLERRKVSGEPLIPAERPYFRRVLAEAAPHAKEHFGVKIIASTFTGLLLAWLKNGSFWLNGAWAVGGFAVFMILAFLLELLLAPRRLDKARQKETERLSTQITLLQEDIALLQAEIAESKRVKLTFEVLTEIWNSKVSLDDPGDTEDYRDAYAFFLTAELWLRFYNDDPEPVRLHDISLSIVTIAGSEQPLPNHINPPSMQEPDKAQTYLTPFVISGNKQTDSIYFRFFVDVPRECALSVDENSFLRVTIEAGTQDLYSVDVNVPWEDAWKGLAEVTIRPEVFIDV